MSHARFLVGDVFDRLAQLEDGSVDLVLTSPPFLALRSYLPADHPDKAKEIGSEPTPAEFLDTLLALSAEWRRVLAPHGSIAVELGDTYSGSGESGWERDTGEFRRENRSAQSAAGGLQQKRDRRAGWPLAKSMCGIPHLYHLSLAYGRNLLTGEASPAGRWRVRNVVAWCRPNPPVGALGDKFRPATSYMTIATVARDRYFDLDAVRGNPEDVKDQRHRTTNGPKQNADPSEVLTANYHQRIPSHPGGPPPLDWWEIPTQPYSGAHYATWPMALCERPIEAMCPRRVCLTCGTPSRRIVEQTNEEYARLRAEINGSNTVGGKRAEAVGGAKVKSEAGAASLISNGVVKPEHTTTGWTTCGCPGTDGIRLDGYHTGVGWRPGIVLDPFAGSGTTLAVATGHGRDAIGIDLDERNADLARERVGMFLDVEHPTAEVVA